MARESLPAGAGAEGAGEVISLYEIRRKIHPRAVHGWFAAWRVALVVATQLVYYGLPWLTWNDRPAVLFDLGARKFYLFGLVLWPQDVIYLAVLLIICAYALFLFTAVAGRLWCGYACPQTVYTEMFMAVERWIEGDRIARLRLDAAPMSVGKFGKRFAKHAIWIAIALWTGITFVAYFTPIRDLLARLPLGLTMTEGFWVLFYGFATYGNAGWMREQVCKYMCPYARFQSVMFDKDTLVIAYDSGRGEPRGARSRKADPKAAGLGDCIDCRICVQVCPTGIDIREGLQYECISCAACIDGCDQVMDKMGYPRGLIRHVSEAALSSGASSREMWRQVARPRTLIYTGVLLVIVAATAFSLATRSPLKVDVLRDRGALAREVAGGRIENVYRLQLMNTDETPRRLTISARGLQGLEVAGVDQPVAMEAAGSRLLPVRLVAPGDVAAPGSHKIEIVVAAEDDPELSRIEATTFIVPRR